MNGDGFDDVIVADIDGDAFLFYGPFCPGLYTTAQADVVFDVGNGNGYGNWKLNTVGDLNDDGFAEVHAGPFIYFGPPAPTSVDALGRPLVETADLALPGQGITSPGDVDGDGFPDLVSGIPPIGAPGLVLVYLGPFNPDGTTQTPLYDYTLTGEIDSDTAGMSFAPLGDLDGDGTADFAVGAYGARDSGVVVALAPGAVYVVKGPIAEDRDLGESFAKIVGALGYRMGSAIGTAPDQTGDGLGELMISAVGGNTAYWVPSPIPEGLSEATSIGVALIDSTPGFPPGAGFSQAMLWPQPSVGIVGVVRSAYLLWGAPPSTWSAATHPDRIEGIANTPSGGLGSSLSLVGDVNADGFEDFVLGSISGNAFLWLGGPPP